MSSNAKIFAESRVLVNLLLNPVILQQFDYTAVKGSELGNLFDSLAKARLRTEKNKLVGQIAKLVTTPGERIKLWLLLKAAQVGLGERPILEIASYTQLHQACLYQAHKSRCYLLDIEIGPAVHVIVHVGSVTAYIDDQQTSSRLPWSLTFRLPKNTYDDKQGNPQLIPRIDVTYSEVNHAPALVSTHYFAKNTSGPAPLDIIIDERHSELEACPKPKDDVGVVVFASFSNGLGAQRVLLLGGKTEPPPGNMTPPTHIQRFRIDRVEEMT